MNKVKILRVILLILIALLLVGLGVGYYFWHSHFLVCQSPIQVSSWREALGRTSPDKSNFQLTKVVSSPLNALYVGVLKVGSKSVSLGHSHGEEVFQVLSGEAVLHSGRVDASKKIFWYENLTLKEGDAFFLPPHTVMQLETSGSNPFIFSLFAPNEHFQEDRFFVGDYNPDGPSACH